MIREMMPDAKKIGILYTTSEANSVSALAKYDDLAGDYGFEIVEKGISQTADISLAADELLGEVDCLTNLTDNTVVASLATILDKANAKKIPVFGSEIEQVKIGCLAAEGLDYVALGKQTGKMAAKILKGEKKASDMQFETITEPGFYVNNEVAKNLGITVPEDLQDKAVESFDEITNNERIRRRRVMGIYITILEQGLIYGILALGVYITYKILDFPDLTVDGSFPLGAALTATMITKGVNPYLTLPASFLIGVLAGICTGLIHVKCKVRDLLSGIIMMTALWTINLRLAGTANVPIFGEDSIFDNAAVNGIFQGGVSSYKVLVIVLIIAVVSKVLLDLYMKTKSGFLLRAVGDNEVLVTSLAKMRGMSRSSDLRSPMDWFPWQDLFSVRNREFLKFPVVQVPLLSDLRA